MDVLYVRKEVVCASSQLKKCEMDYLTHDVELTIVELGSIVILDVSVLSLGETKVVADTFSKRDLR